MEFIIFLEHLPKHLWKGIRESIHTHCLLVIQSMHDFMDLSFLKLSFYPCGFLHSNSIKFKTIWLASPNQLFRVKAYVKMYDMLTYFFGSVEIELLITRDLIVFFVWFELAKRWKILVCLIPFTIVLDICLQLTFSARIVWPSSLAISYFLLLYA